MVQRKGPKGRGSKAKGSENQQQDKRSNGQGGGDELSKKMRKPSPPRTSGGLPNYMKPTSNSDARKDRLQVTIQTPDVTKIPKNQNSNLSRQSLDLDTKPARSLTRKSSLKPMRSSMKKSSGMGNYPKTNVIRPTCSSTLKDSKFPKELDVSEPEGVSIMKVCPYTYCSLNGHTHERLPPLKSFLSARRQMVKTQKSMKLKRLSSLIAISRMPSGLDLDCLSVASGSNFFVEIYDKPQSQMTQMNSFNEAEPEVVAELSLMEDDWEHTANDIYTASLDANYKNDLDLIGGFTAEEMDLLNEYAGWDSDSSIANQLYINTKDPFEINDLAESKAYIRASFEANDDEYPVANPMIEIADAGDIWSSDQENSSFTSEIIYINGTENPVITVVDYGTDKEKGKEEVENYSSVSEFQNYETPQEHTKSADNITELDCMEIEMEIFTDLSDEINIHANQLNMDNEQHGESILIPDKKLQSRVSDTMQIIDDASPSAKEDKTVGTPTLTLSQHLGAKSESKQRYKPSRVRRTEDVQEIREFNPRPPRFLPIEEDPEAEKVRLRSQLMDEKKNAEDWMIDYALQQVVSKLAPARKRKVMLLVEAFETIMPLPIYDTSPKDIAASAYGRHIQACN